MTTYREAIYMCLDILKGMSDDFSYTEDHIAYLLDKYRAFLLKQRYMNDPKKHVPYSNYQTIAIKFSELNTTEEGFYRSDIQVPYMLQLGIPRVSIKDYHEIKFEFVSRERLPYVCENKYLKRFWYCAINEDNHLCIQCKSTIVFSDDSEPLIIKLTGIFENPREITDELSFGEIEGGDDLDRNIPIEEALIPTLIEMVTKHLTSGVYKPEDSTNNASDDNATLAQFLAKNMKSNFQKQLE